VDDVCLRIEPGELFFLLGPSGCGKTTLLRCVAGFCQPDSGAIRIGERDITRLPPHRRDTGMVFQSYALWPHMSVPRTWPSAWRCAPCPRRRSPPRGGRAGDGPDVRPGRHKPNQLSGGQQQRVALARALVIHPQCLLLDEPLSNLDAKLRLDMRGEIRRICKEAGLTAIYVTHDQKEALSSPTGSPFSTPARFGRSDRRGMYTFAPRARSWPTSSARPIPWPAKWSGRAGG
jgi:iron(III) transport system ATP-binding protein